MSENLVREMVQKYPARGRSRINPCCNTTHLKNVDIALPKKRPFLHIKHLRTIDTYQLLITRKNNRKKIEKVNKILQKRFQSITC